jgi:hypothetical protein
MKFKVNLNDVIENNYYKIAGRLFDSGGVRMAIETNKIRLEYQGCEVIRTFDFPESSSSVETKIDAMSQFLDLLLEAIIELMERYNEIKNEFDKKVSRRVESVDNFLRELYNEKYFEERRDDIY